MATATWGDHAVPLAAWAGIRPDDGPTMVIRAERAGDLVEHPEVAQVA